jgi:hypothetical protein
MTLLQKLKASWAYHLATVAIFGGIILTIISAMKLCVSACTETHNFRLFGLPFEAIGAIYFSALLFCHFLARSSYFYRLCAELLLASGVGAESFFIVLQKVQIGAWCPICLSIASCIALAGIGYLIWEKKEQHEGLMRGWLHAGVLMTILTLGFTISFLGITKVDQLQAAEEEIKDRIKFGDRKSPIEVYVFTDWVCPACRAVEPALEAMAPKIAERAQLIFVDTVIHPETLNFAPYNIAFMAQSKPHYFKVRETLNQLSQRNSKPNDEDIQRAVDPIGVKLNELPYEDVAAAMRYFHELNDRYQITSTPTVAIVNGNTQRYKKLSGARQITETNVINAINSLR